MTVNTLITTLSGGGDLKRADLKGFKGFTLAEVLITLVIIGVIAAMTIPTLINKTNNQEYVSKLKKTYSTLSQVTNKILFEEGTPNVSIGGWAVDQEAFFNMYKKYLSNAKECAVGSSCFDTITYKGVDGSNSGDNYYFMNLTDKGRLVLADGTFLNFHLYNVNCAGGQAADGIDAMGATCGYIHVDVNGQKGPNKWGRDAFRFYLTEKGLFPTGCAYDHTTCPAVDKGIPCTCVVIKENAMNY